MDRRVRRGGQRHGRSRRGWPSAPRERQRGADGRRALAEGTIGRGTLHSTARGRIFDVVASPHPSGGAVITFDDVTPHHTLAERYRLVVETASEAIVITDLDRRIAFANPAALRLFGAESDIVGRQVSELVTEEL